MLFSDISAIRELLEAVIAGFSVLGGGMACMSGLYAELARAKGQGPTALAHRINEGIADGFKILWLPSVMTMAIMASS